MERVLQDLRFASRVLSKDRAFAATAILTLAICIGANTAIFAIVDAVLLKPLPVAHPEQLVYMFNSYPGAGVGDRGSTGVPDYYDRLRETDVFQAQALYNTRGVTLGQEGNPERITAMLGTPSFLHLLEVQPIRGRLFTDEEGELGKTNKVILTYASWQRLFGGRDDAIGKDLRINSEPYTVIGVLPQGFSFLEPDVQLWMPLAFTAEERSDDSRHSNNWTYLARLKPGATIEQARQQIDALNARNLERFPAFKQILIDAGFHTVVTPLQTFLVRDLRGTLYLLWGGVVFVLLIGVVNITNLMLVRSTTRMRELATRHALGAGLGRIAGQLLTETLLLTLLGGVGGLAIGAAGVRALAAYGLDETPQGTTIAISPDVALFTLALAIIVGLAIGIAPILALRQMNLSQAFREEGRSGTASRGTRILRRALVTVQVAFAFMLLIGAGLLLASFQRVLAVKPGFNPENVLTGMVSPPRSRYKEDAELIQFANRLLERVRALPGVTAAGITSNLPMSGNYSDSVILAEGYVMKPGESLISPYRIEITPGYLEAMGVPLKRGRLFTASDDERAPKVVIIDERLAAKFFANQDPIGRRLWRPDSAEELSKGPGPKSTFYNIVGVVGDIHVTGLTEKENVGAYYFPVAQDAIRTMTLVVRTPGDPTAITNAVRRDLQSIDPELPFYGVRSMTSRIDETLLDRRTPMMLALSFAIIALFLASVGIYGVLAYQVSQRRREIGIRMALGSDAGSIFSLVVREGLMLVAIGLGAGFIGAFAIRRAMEAQLFGIGPMDPLVLSVVVVTLGIVALLACAIPARRAARIDPLVALADQ
ncbi:MAG TPA: ABC transporter permease [Vicinamibacterales bacterium]|nr:ABC transporter permease [Vicinamibacterales bacterium]